MPCLGEKPKEHMCTVKLLDEKEFTVSVKLTWKGQALLDKVFEHLNLIEREYFGLRYLDATSQTYWLDPLKSLSSQLKGGQPIFYFGVKFYAADPCKLYEEITRYQFFQQIKRDIAQGRLLVPFETAAELFGYVLQSDLGDYDPKRHSLGYVSEYRFCPSQSVELEARAMHMHQQIPKGQVPSVSEYKFLDKVKWLDMYGVDLHPAQGEGNVEFFVGLTPTGIVVYRNQTKTGNYFWPRITKITFKGKTFMLRVKDKNNEENTHTFECNTKQACRHLWKCCIEHHTFFRSAPLRIENYTKRLSQAQNSVSGPGKVFSLGSKHRYSGRTERQALADLMNRPQPQVVRTPSTRYNRRASMDSQPGSTAVSLQGHVDGPVTTIVTPEPVKTPSEQRKSFPVPDSPHSTRSAPWESGHHRKGGLYTSGRDSPMSTRSERMLFPKHARAHSGSESESGGPRRDRRRESDNESEVSAAKRHRRRKERGGAASEGELEPSREMRRQARHSRRSAENLAYTEDKWQDIQRRIRDGTYGTPYDTGRELRPNGSVHSMPGSEITQQQIMQQKRRRRRSRSPGNKRPPDELAQHFKYVEPDPAMTSEQLRDIPYTKVETAADAPRVRQSPHSRHRHRSPGRRRSYGEESHASHRSGGHIPQEEPPPPYSGPPGPGAPYQQLQQQPYQQLPPHQSHYPQLQPHLQYNNTYRNKPEIEALVQPPVSVYMNEAHTAPIVKTKPVAVYGGAEGGSHHHYAHTQQQMQLASPSHRSIQHSRDDSGLGIEQPDMRFYQYRARSALALWDTAHTVYYGAVPRRSAAYSLSHHDRHFKRSSAFEPLSGGISAGYHSNLAHYHDTRSLASVKSDPYRYHYPLDRSRATSNHSISSNLSANQPGSRQPSNYKVFTKPLYVEQVSSEFSPAGGNGSTTVEGRSSGHPGLSAPPAMYDVYNYSSSPARPEMKHAMSTPPVPPYPRKPISSNQNLMTEL